MKPDTEHKYNWLNRVEPAVEAKVKNDTESHVEQNHKEEHSCGKYRISMKMVWYS